VRRLNQRPTEPGRSHGASDARRVHERWQAKIEDAFGWWMLMDGAALRVAVQLRYWAAAIRTAPRTHRSPSAPNTGFRGFDLTILDGTMKLRRATNPGVSRGIRHVGEEANEPNLPLSRLKRPLSTRFRRCADRGVGVVACDRPQGHFYHRLLGGLRQVF